MEIDAYEQLRLSSLLSNNSGGNTFTIPITSTIPFPSAVTRPHVAPTPVSSTSAHGTVVEEPSLDDVLFGRGQPIRDHEGNHKMRDYVERYTFEYSQASREEKTLLAHRIVAEMKNDGCRFLKPHLQSWIQVTDWIACRKVSHAIRDNISRITTAAHLKEK